MARPERKDEGKKEYGSANACKDGHDEKINTIDSSQV
jgi:hypothetical protein